jgi:polyferredoxin
VECPTCGEIFSASALEPATTSDTVERKPGLREKILYYTGIALIVIGGPGIALGSWLHDILRLSFLNYNAFSVFGPMNRLFLAVGLVVMIVGVLFLLLSLQLSRPAKDEGTP